MFDTKNIFSILFDELWARPDLVRTRPDFGPDQSPDLQNVWHVTLTSMIANTLQMIII